MHTYIHTYAHIHDIKMYLCIFAHLQKLPMTFNKVVAYILVEDLGT